MNYRTAIQSLLNAIMFTAFAVTALAQVARAAEPPDAPSSLIRRTAPVLAIALPASVPKPAEESPIDKKFVSLAFVSTSSTFADSYTTLFARRTG
jgi:hypothetical protein